MDTIRLVTQADIVQLKTIIDKNGLFPPDMLDDMLQPYLQGSASGEFWLTDEADNTLITIAYCAPERMTQGTWNVLLIAVLPEQQHKGCGAAMMNHIESMLKIRGERMILVETSALPSYESARAFYHRCGYTQEARIRNFYAAGEDKLVFCKSLTDK
jgi:ribosomal protein S18 acetylase RimI-like enzyme